MIKDLTSELERLQSKAEVAEGRFDHETAVSRYSAALSLPDLSAEEKFELLDGRASAYHHWGDRKRYAQNVMELIALARQMGEKRRLAEAMAVHGFQLAKEGPEIPSEEFVLEAIKLADDFQDDCLRCYGHMTLVMLRYAEGNVVAAWDLLHESLDYARLSEDKNVLFAAVEFLAGAYAVFNQPEQAQELAREARTLAEISGSPYKMFQAAEKSAMAATDLALTRNYYEEALSAAKASNNQVAVSEIANQMGLLAWKLGLYDNALVYAGEATESARRMELPNRVANNLDAVSRAYLGKGMFNEARLAIEEGLNQDVMAWTTEIYLKFGLGLVALGEHDNKEAVSHFQSLLDAFDPLKPVVYAALGAAYLAIGDIQKALVLTSTAVSFLEAGSTVNEYPTQEVWWRHYQVLQITDPQASFSALDHAKQAMIAAIEKLSDEGIRRNYLNKGAVNRAITLAWTEEAAHRDIPLDIFTNHQPIAGNLREQFRRVVDIGARLTAQHDPDLLADFIVQEFVGMSGAERVLLMRLEDGRSQVVASYNPENTISLAESLLAPILQNRRPLLREDVGQAAEGEVPVIHQRSLVALPLIAQGRLLGMIYGDLRQIFGRFDDSDLRLLSMLANQAAAALDNADLVTTLEQKVEARTADLAERNNELAIINSVQEGLVAELELQAIFDLVGNQVYEISKAQMVAICIFDFEANKVHTPFDIEDGRRLDNPGREIDSRTWDDIKEPHTIYLPTLDEIKAYFGPEIVDKVPEGTAVSSSILNIPMIVGDTMVGYLDLQDEKPHAFSEPDIQLMTTLARSMSVALENARLFQDAREARAQAEAANESKSRFLSSMSHELRTPLNAIIGFTRIVRRKTKGEIPQKQTDNLDKVQSSAEHLLGLINTILDLAKIEAGRVDVINELFEVGPVVEMCTAVTKPMLKPGVFFEIDVPSDLPTISSDQDKVKQILLNLLSNAAKFTHQGKIVVSCEFRVSSKESLLATRSSDSSLIIKVTDTGIGMNEEQVARVFEEFQQAEETTSREYGGTGLGLPISKQLAQLLGGDLTVASVPGEGSTFVLEVPVGREENN